MKIILPAPVPSTISRNGKIIRVKNLGWLLRNWQQVESFAVWPHPELARGMKPDAILIATLKDGERYQTSFACATVLRDWLSRPVFRTVLCTWHINGNGNRLPEPVTAPIS